VGTPWEQEGRIATNRRIPIDKYFIRSASYCLIVHTSQPQMTPNCVRHPRHKDLSSSEIKLQAELDNARVLCGENLPESACIAPNIRWVEVSVVKRIEDLSTKLHIS
jgi:hypothetical protein